MSGLVRAWTARLASLPRVGFRRWPLAGRAFPLGLGAASGRLGPMIERTAMFIDLQGFSALYGPNTKADSLWGLSDLMEGIYRLGRDSTRLGISRLFAHQIGDGFVLVDDGGIANISRLVAAAVALHQFTLVRAGHFCASAIDRGGMADVVGCYPEIVRQARTREGVVPLGDGLMTIFPVMGTALINTYRILGQAKGAVILVPETHAAGLEPGIRTTTAEGLLFVDWIASDSPGIATARGLLGIGGLNRGALVQFFNQAVSRNNCKPEWVARTSRFLSRD